MGHLLVVESKQQSVDHEWVDLMREAKEMGLTAEDIRTFLAGAERCPSPPMEAIK